MHVGFSRWTKHRKAIAYNKEQALLTFQNLDIRLIRISN